MNSNPIPIKVLMYGSSLTYGIVGEQDTGLTNEQYKQMLFKLSADFNAKSRTQKGAIK